MDPLGGIATSGLGGLPTETGSRSFKRSSSRPRSAFESCLIRCLSRAFRFCRAIISRLFGGDRQGQYSIRINQQWRLCFEWPDGELQPFNIEIVDYH